jgi:hypothetical protein
MTARVTFTKKEKTPNDFSFQVGRKKDRPASLDRPESGTINCQGLVLFINRYMLYYFFILNFLKESNGLCCLIQKSI